MHLKSSDLRFNRLVIKFIQAWRVCEKMSHTILNPGVAIARKVTMDTKFQYAHKYCLYAALAIILLIKFIKPKPQTFIATFCEWNVRPHGQPSCLSIKPYLVFDRKPFTGSWSRYCIQEASGTQEARKIDLWRFWVSDQYSMQMQHG